MLPYLSEQGFEVFLEHENGPCWNIWTEEKSLDLKDWTLSVDDLFDIFVIIFRSQLSANVFWLRISDQRTIGLSDLLR